MFICTHWMHCFIAQFIKRSMQITNAKTNSAQRNLHGAISDLAGHFFVLGWEECIRLPRYGIYYWDCKTSRNMSGNIYTSVRSPLRDMVVGKIRGRRKKYFPMFCVPSRNFAFPRKTFAFSRKDICVLSQNLCVLSQRYLRSLAKPLRSLAKIFAFSRKTVVFSRETCVLARGICFALLLV